jgi:hypothetical protein
MKKHFKKGDRKMMTREEHDEKYGTTDFDRMSVYAWDFVQKWQSK